VRTGAYEETLTIDEIETNAFVNSNGRNLRYFCCIIQRQIWKFDWLVLL
jgi:hypothetical protein